MYKRYKFCVILLGMFFLSFVAFLRIGLAAEQDGKVDKIEKMIYQSKERGIIDWGNGIFTVLLKTKEVMSKPNLVFEMKDIDGKYIPSSGEKRENYDCKKGENFCSYNITADFSSHYNPNAPSFGYSGYVIRSAKGKVFIEEEIPKFVAILNTQTEYINELDVNKTVFLNLKNNSSKTLVITSVESGNDKLKILNKVPQGGNEWKDKSIYDVRIALPQVINVAYEDSFPINVKYKVEGIGDEIDTTVYLKLGFREDNVHIQTDNGIVNNTNAASRGELKAMASSPR